MHENFLNENRIKLRSQQIFKSDRHDVSTITVNKIALGSVDKRIQTFDIVKTFCV